jgi:hypothetical protein
MAGGELRRSYTQMDFSLNRVNIRPQMPQFFHQQPNMQVTPTYHQLRTSTTEFLDYLIDE